MSHAYCPECGFQNPEAANYCARCGAYLRRDEQGETTLSLDPEELVEDDAGIAVAPQDPTAIASAISEVLADHELATRLSLAGRHRAEIYSWAHTAELVEAAYRELTA